MQRLIATMLAALAVGTLAPAASRAQQANATITGPVTVLDPNGSSVPAVNSQVTVCPTPSFTSCQIDHTGPDGVFKVTGLGLGEYAVAADPPAGVNASPAIDVVRVTEPGMTVYMSLALHKLTPIPAGTTLTPSTTNALGLPVLTPWDPLTLTTAGCAQGTATYTITQLGSQLRTGSLTESPAGTYMAIVAPLSVVGEARVKISIDCPPGTPDDTREFDVYIDPSGTVSAVDGTPIDGATVTLYRATTPIDPFVMVPDGSLFMSPGNRHNPDLTNAAGHFGWDVATGWYRVRAEKAGCSDPNDPTKDYVETAIMKIPPPVMNLDLRLACPSGEDGDITGTVPEMLSLTLGAKPTFGAFIPSVGRTYTASTVVDVTSSAGNAALDVRDATGKATGRLVNGAFALASPLEARGDAPGFAALTSPVRLHEWGTPITRDLVSVEFRQAIGPIEPLRAGTYGKTLTYILTTTVP